MKRYRKRFMNKKSCLRSLRGCSIPFKSVKTIKPATRTKTGIYEIEIKR